MAYSLTFSRYFMLPALPSDADAACKKALLIRIFLAQKTFQPFSIALIYLYIRKIWLNGLRRIPFSTTHRQIALEGPAVCLRAPQFKADIFCYPQENFS